MSRPSHLSLILLIASTCASADVVKLTNGKTMDGIVSEKTPDGIMLDVDHIGSIFIASSAVVSITKTADADSKLRAKWDKEALEEDEARAVDGASRKKNRSAGLVLYKGEWMTPAQSDAQIRADRAENGDDPDDRGRDSLTIVNNYVYNTMNVNTYWWQAPVYYAYAPPAPAFTAEPRIPVYAPFGVMANKTFSFPTVSGTRMLGVSSSRR